MSVDNPLSLFDVEGKVALITGASGAFGAVAARALSGAGCRVVLVAGNQESMSRVAELCKGETHLINARPDSEEACDSIIAGAVQAFGRVDILVVASGMNKVSKITEMDASDFDGIMDANVRQCWLMSRATTRQMKKQKSSGKIILMSSARGLLGHPAGYTAYCASKSAVDGITKALGCELGADGITVNAIAPTVFRSPLTAWMFEDTKEAKAVREGFLTRVPLGRLGEPEDLAGPLLFLSSKASDFYTGHVIYADGGYTAG